MAPTVQAFLLADAVYKDGASGKHIIAGSFTQMAVAHFPAEHPPVAAFCALTDLDGSITISLRVVAPSGRVVTRSSPTEITCTDRRLMIEFAFPIPSLRLLEAGWYRLDMLLDDVELAHLSFEVVAR